MKLVFLDMDGVLNRCGYGREAYDPMLVGDCVRAFNRLIEATRPSVVLSSSWRYMVLGGAATIGGFENLLLTHRARCRLIGVTPSDEQVEGRGMQITVWLESHGYGPGTRYVVLDDDDDGISAQGHPFVHTTGIMGLTEADADRAIEILNGKEAKCPRP